MLQLAIEYVQCYWQSFGLGMLVAFFGQKIFWRYKYGVEL